MESRRKQLGRPKLRFSFSGRVERRREDSVTVDDILDSMSRRVKLSAQLDPDTLSPFENDQGEAYQSNSTIPAGVGIRRRSIFGKLAFAALLAAGIIVVSLYGALASLFDPSLINQVTQNPSLMSVLADPTKIGLLALVCLVPILIFMRRPRRQVRLM